MVVSCMFVLSKLVRDSKCTSIMIQIPNKVFEKWEALKADGDFNRIAEMSGVHPNTVRRAYEKGYCSPEVLEAIIRLYEDREELLREYLD